MADKAILLVEEMARIGAIQHHCSEMTIVDEGDKVAYAFLVLFKRLPTKEEVLRLLCGSAVSNVGDSRWVSNVAMMPWLRILLLHMQCEFVDVALADVYVVEGWVVPHGEWEIHSK